jgi:hypothetical protein
MSPLAHHARSHRDRIPDRPFLLGIRVPHRLTVATTTTWAASQRLRVFRSGTNGGAPLQSPKTLALPVAIRRRPRCPPTADVVAHRFPQSQCGAHSRGVPVGLRESRRHCTARWWAALRSVIHNIGTVSGSANDSLHLDSARSASYVKLHISGKMLSFQKCEADAKDPVVRRQSRERTQHLCNPWQVFERGSTQPIASALVLRECLARRCCELFCRCGKGLPLNSSAR